MSDVTRSKKLIITEDGSHSLYMPELKESYHSVHGAIQESMHVFIEAGLKEIFKTNKAIQVLEMGFGTGLNAFLTLIEAEKVSKSIQYTTLETNLLQNFIVKQLNYGSEIEHGKWKEYFSKIHNAPWEIFTTVSDYFSIKKNNKSVLEFNSICLFDLVYFDAFAPEVQPELWTADVFANIYSFMNRGGILVTYCCKGYVKRNMKQAGFTIEKLPGPPGKREILRAWKL
jgi:tRNA U34 5-methylaminomethyl-2-thiouridine-forming methyltransferase MnmC